MKNTIKKINFFNLPLVALVMSMAMFGCNDNTKTDAQATTPNVETQSSTESNKTVIKVAYLPITHALPVLEEADLINNDPNSNVKVELIRYGSWPELLDALNTGNVDAASVLVELAIKAKEQGIDLKALALGHTDGNVLVVDNEIQDASQLKGKTIAIPHRQSSHYLLVIEALARANLTIDDVNIVEIAPTEMPSALASKQISAYCVAEPFGAKSVSLNIGKVLFTSQELWPHSICCALVFNNLFLKNHPELAKEFIRKYHESAHALENKEHALEVASKKFKQDKATLEQSLAWISFDNLQITEENYQKLSERIINAKLSDKVPEYKDFVVND